MRRALILIALLGACTPQEAPEKPIGYRDGNAGKDAEGAVAAKEQAALDEAAARAATSEDTAPTILELTLTPEEVHLDSVMEATAVINENASSFTDVDYTWYVNGEELRSVRRARISVEDLGAKKKDSIQVAATAIDETGRSSTKKSKRHLVVNSTPYLTSDVSKSRGLNGLRFTAEDPDGDPLVWEVRAGPPGVTIDRNGFVRVEARDLTEAFDGEVVIAAVDPDGAAAEAHIPVTINAATDGTTEKSVETKEHNRFGSDLKTLEDKNVEALDAIEKMTPEEFDKYVRDQENREKMPDAVERR